MKAQSSSGHVALEIMQPLGMDGSVVLTKWTMPHKKTISILGKRTAPMTNGTEPYAALQKLASFVQALTAAPAALYGSNAATVINAVSVDRRLP